MSQYQSPIEQQSPEGAELQESFQGLMSRIDQLLENPRTLFYHRELEYRMDQLVGYITRADQLGIADTMMQGAFSRWEEKYNYLITKRYRRELVAQASQESRGNGKEVSDYEITNLISGFKVFYDDTMQLLGVMQSNLEEPDPDSPTGDILLLQPEGMDDGLGGRSEPLITSLHHLFDTGNPQHEASFHIPEPDEIEDPGFTIGMYQAALVKAEDLQQEFNRIKQAYTDRYTNLLAWCAQEMEGESMSRGIEISSEEVNAAVLELAQTSPDMPMQDALQQARNHLLESAYQQRSAHIREEMKEIHHCLRDMDELVEDKNRLFQYSEDGSEELGEDPIES